MSDKPIGSKIPDPVNALAEHIRWVAATDGTVKKEMVEWEGHVKPSEAVQEFLVLALEDDLYIDLDDAFKILGQAAPEEKEYVSALVRNLRSDPPLFKYVRTLQQDCGREQLQLFCDKGKMEIRIREALQAATQDPDGKVGKEAEQLLQEFSTMALTSRE